MLYVTGWPAFTVAGPVFVVATSAWLSTVVVTRLAGRDPLLLAGFRSALAAVLATMFVNDTRRWHGDGDGVGLARTAR